MRAHLMVEGRDDWFVIKNLLLAHAVKLVERSDQELEVTCNDVTATVGYSAYGEGGIPELLKSLPVRLKQSGLDRLVVVVDADTDLSARWASVTDVLARAGAETPLGSPHAGGTRFSIPSGPTVDVWVMPDNSVAGMLEDFLRALVPKECSLLPQVDGFIASLPAAPNRYREAHRAKAVIHTWLSIQDPPGRPLGQAVMNRMVDPFHEPGTVFVTWLKNALVGP